jgi:hypothetical protein
MTDDTKVRLLICGVCKSIEELPWFEGPQEYDDTGNFRLGQHRFASGNLHPFTVGDVLKREWDNPTIQRAIVTGITEQVEGLKEGGLGDEFYDVRSTFFEDAMACWKRHNRTTNCTDYKTDRMRLLPDTRAERKELGLEVKNRPSTHLCDFCPYKSVVQKKYVKDKGLDA